MNQKTPNLDAVLVVGGLIAGAYIVYKFSGGFKSVQDWLNSAADKTKQAVEKTKDAAVEIGSTISNNWMNQPLVDLTMGRSVTVSNPSDSIYVSAPSFDTLLKTDPFDVTDPMNSYGRVYEHVNESPIVTSRIENPFSYL